MPVTIGVLKETVRGENRVAVVPEVAGVSSTAIRTSLAEGDVAGAAEMLGRPFEAA